jgi:hypothetical protein
MTPRDGALQTVPGALPYRRDVLLAVDLGLRTGVATYGHDGRLRTYRSQNLGSRQRLRRAAWHHLDETGAVEWLVMEGDAALGRAWTRAAERHGARSLHVPAEAWRQRLLRPSERRSGKAAKEAADHLAREVIAWSGARRPTSLRHDAAEAILIGLWGVLEVGWLEELPAALRR